jgi:flagellar protein FlaG
MNVESVNTANVLQQASQKPSDDVAAQRKARDSGAEVADTSAAKSKVQPEELLSQIKALTEDGLYSVRFENNAEADQMVVKIVSTSTHEVIRQVPVEEVINMSTKLEQLRGNMVDTAS